MMKEELKTLKDIKIQLKESVKNPIQEAWSHELNWDRERSVGALDILKELKQEAIKWVKQCTQRVKFEGSCGRLAICSDKTRCIACIRTMKMNNITEEDITVSETSLRLAETNLSMERDKTETKETDVRQTMIQEKISKTKHLHKYQEMRDRYVCIECGFQVGKKVLMEEIVVNPEEDNDEGFLNPISIMLVIIIAMLLHIILMGLGII